MSAVEVHNRFAGSLTTQLVKAVRARGGSPADVLVLLESVNVGVLAYVAEATVSGLTTDEILAAMVERIPARVAEARARLGTAGEA